MDMLQAVKTYNCPGCMHGPEAPECPQYSPDGVGCSAHYPGCRGEMPAAVEITEDHINNMD